MYAYLAMFTNIPGQLKTQKMCDKAITKYQLRQDT